VEIFVNKQMELMKKGLTEEEAFQICVREKEMEQEALQYEKELMKQQVSSFFRSLSLSHTHTLSKHILNTHTPSLKTTMIA
jgi:hypothetical protein